VAVLPELTVALADPEIATVKSSAATLTGDVDEELVVKLLSPLYTACRALVDPGVSADVLRVAVPAVNGTVLNKVVPL
jgi:hypothetical protein